MWKIVSIQSKDLGLRFYSMSQKNNVLSHTFKSDDNNFIRKKYDYEIFNSEA